MVSLISGTLSMMIWIGRFVDPFYSSAPSPVALLRSRQF